MRHHLSIFSVIVGPMVRQNQKELADILQGDKFDSFLCNMTKMLVKNGTEFMVGNGVSFTRIR